MVQHVEAEIEVGQVCSTTSEGDSSWYVRIERGICGSKSDDGVSVLDACQGSFLKDSVGLSLGAGGVMKRGEQQVPREESGARDRVLSLLLWSGSGGRHAHSWRYSHSWCFQAMPSGVKP